MSLLIASRVGAWSSTISTRDFLGSDLSDVVALTLNSIIASQLLDGAISTGLTYARRLFTRPHQRGHSDCLLGLSPNTSFVIGVFTWSLTAASRQMPSVPNKLARPERRLIHHSATLVDVIAHVVVTDPTIGRVRKLAQRAQRSQPALRVTRVEVEVNAGKRQRRADVANPDRDQCGISHVFWSGAIAVVAELDALHRRVVKKSEELFRRFVARTVVPVAQIAAIQVVLLARRDRRSNRYAEVGVAPPAAPLRFAGLEASDRNAKWARTRDSRDTRAGR